MQPQASVQEENPPGAILLSRPALWLGAAFLLCLLGVVLFTVAEFGSGPKRESFSETTAAGDIHYFQMPVQTPAGAERGFTWSGRHFVLANREKVKIDDTDMLRIGQEETGGYWLYSARDKPGRDLYVKIDVGEFLPLKER